MIINKIDARIILNALRNGGIPKNYLEDIIIGRDLEIEEFNRNLSNLEYETGSFKMILGDFGTGKTFLINIFKKIALQKDYVVSSFQVDRVMRMNKLDDLFYYIMHNLYVKKHEKVATFDNIFDIWIDNLKNAPNNMQATNEINLIIQEVRKFNEAFARALLSLIRSKIKGDNEMTDAVGAWLSGEKNIPYELKTKFNVTGGVNKSNMFDFLKAFSKLVQMLGYNGLVIMIDEIDLILNERVDIRKNAYNNIKHLIDFSVTGDLNRTMFLLTGVESIVDNKEKGLRSNEALSQRLGDAIDSYDSSLVDLRQPITKIQKLGLKDFGEITDKVTEIFKVAYEIDIKITKESLKNWVLYVFNKDGRNLNEIKVREFITKLIVILDTIEQNPNNYIYSNNLKMTFKNDNPVFTNVLNKIN